MIQNENCRDRNFMRGDLLYDIKALNCVKNFTLMTKEDADFAWNANTDGDDRKIAKRSAFLKMSSSRYRFSRDHIS
jgi:hypothetical protein